MATNSIANGKRTESWITQSIIPIGYPLRGYNSSVDRIDDQAAIIDKFITNHVIPTGDNYFEGNFIQT